MDTILHSQAKQVAGDLLDHLDSKPTAFLVAVLWRDLPNPVSNLQRDSFMFIKCSGKTTAGKINESYLKHDDQTEHVSLSMANVTPPDSSKMTELDYFNDRVVVFNAQDPSADVMVNDAPGTGNQPYIESRPPGASSVGQQQSSRSSWQSLDASALASASTTRAPSKSSMSRYTQSPRPGSPYAKPSPSLPSSLHQLGHQPTPGLTPQYAPSHGTLFMKSEGHRHPQLPVHPQSFPHNSPQSALFGHGSPISRSSAQPQPSPHPHFPSHNHAYNSGRGSSAADSGHQEHPVIKPDIKPEVELPAPLPAQPMDGYMNEPSFDNIPPADGHDDDFSQTATSSVYLQELAKETSTGKLELGVKKGVQLLDRLVQELQPGAATDDVTRWLRQIETVRRDATRARTVVGVVGNTGAGKSSVINAILDEERLVPTNCMRACTAVVTEMSYNDVDDESQKYRAEIEFIKPEEWEKELKVLFDEIIDGGGNISSDVYNQDSEAGIAYAKIRAVYWKLTQEDLAASSVEKLMADRSVRNILGTTRYIKDRYCDSFYKSLQKYVDSKEKAEQTSKSKSKEKDKDEKKKRKREQEVWPLIKVVRLYVKADALSTGAVLVDLPGVADSNAARAAVAEGYMKQCTGLWIVSPINRAVDDKAAKKLLGASFRRQLKYDGTYSAVTFICSKTDDISNTEAVDSLGLGDEVGVLDDQLQVNERRLREQTMGKQSLNDQRGILSQTMDECDDEIETWETLAEKERDGETVYGPVAKTRKRKRSAFSSDSEKSGDESNKSGDDTELIDRGPPLNAEDIETKVHELREKKKQARRQRSEIDAQLKEVNAKIKETKAENETIEAKRSQICIAGRNEYSKSAIQLDFAAGIKELDQETQMEENPDEFNPEEDLRDYDAVAQSLPVFCVSSRAYQKLSGRLVKDHAVRGFTEVDQTEIPALQGHCKRLTENVRAVGCRRFLNALSQLRNSMALWSSNDGTGIKMTDQQKDAEQRFLNRKLKDLEKAFDDTLKGTLTEMKETLGENIFDNYAMAVNAASESALPTSEQWGAHKNAGGLPWSTYKATVRRQGVFAGAAGARDFNAALTEPIYKHLAQGWEKTFQRRLPQVLKLCAKAFTAHLRDFHKAIESHSLGHGGNPRIGLLAQQLQAYENVLNDLAGKMGDVFNERQREVNREFTPPVCEAMIPAYDVCVAESGKGQFVRMKQHMHNHVLAQKESMFQNAAQIVKRMLHDMCKIVEEGMADRTDEVFVAVRRDYVQVLSNIRVDDVKMPRWERSMRIAIEDIIKQSEDEFAAVLEGRVQALEEDSASGAEKEQDAQLSENEEEQTTEDAKDGGDEKNDTPAKGDIDMEDA